jgi:PPP family 3-phenylpropionic acid transporter
MRKTWLFTFNFLLFAGIACVSPFIVLYYQELGFTGAQIGLLAGVTPLVTFVSAPLWSGLADATRRHRLIMSLAILFGVMVLCIFPFLSTFVPIFVVAILYTIFIAPVAPFADSATMFMLGDKKELYGRIRVGGTIGYGLAASAAGLLIKNYGLRFAFWGCAALFLLMLGASQQLVHDRREVGAPVVGSARALLLSPRWLLFLAMAFAGGMALAAQNTYFLPYLKELGADEAAMGLALTIGTISEVPVLFFANWLLKRLRPTGLFMLTLIITSLRFFLYAVTGTPGMAMFIQLLNGLTIPAMWVAGVAYADENAPPGLRTTAQGLFSALVLGFGLSAGGLIGGLVLGSMGGHALYLVFGVIVLAIVVMVTLIQRWLPTEESLSGVVIGKNEVRG